MVKNIYKDNCDNRNNNNSKKDNKQWNEWFEERCNKLVECLLEECIRIQDKEFENSSYVRLSSYIGLMSKQIKDEHFKSPGHIFHYGHFSNESKSYYQTKKSAIVLNSGHYKNRKDKEKKYDYFRILQRYLYDKYGWYLLDMTGFNGDRGRDRVIDIRLYKNEPANYEIIKSRSLWHNMNVIPNPGEYEHYYGIIIQAYNKINNNHNKHNSYDISFIKSMSNNYYGDKLLCF